METTAMKTKIGVVRKIVSRRLWCFMEMPLFEALYSGAKKWDEMENDSPRFRICVADESDSSDWVQKHWTAFWSARHILRLEENRELMRIVQKRVSRVLVTNYECKKALWRIPAGRKLALFNPFLKTLILAKGYGATDNYLYLAAAIAGLAAGTSIVRGKIKYDEQAAIEAQKRIVKSAKGNEAFYSWAFGEDAENAEEFTSINSRLLATREARRL